jgi:hypothetical protein
MVAQNHLASQGVESMMHKSFAYKQKLNLCAKPRYVSPSCFAGLEKVCSSRTIVRAGHLR